MANYLDDINIFLSVGVALALYLLGLFYAMSNKTIGRSFAIKIFSVAFLVRVMAIFAIYFSLVSMGGDGYVIKDDRAYNKAALDIAADLENHKPGFKEYGTGYVNIAYFNLNGFLYHYLDFDTLTMRVLNTFFGSIVVLLAYYVMLQLFDFKIARIAAILIAIIPNMVFWSASQVKDPLIMLCTMSIIYIMICKLRSSINIIYFVPYLFFMFLLWHLRKDFCFPLISISIVWLAFRLPMFKRYFDNPRRAVFIKMAAMSVLAMPLLVGLMATSAGEGFAGTMTRFNKVQEAYSEAGAGQAVGFSRYLRVVSIKDFYKIPPAMAFTAIAPLPTIQKVIDPINLGSKLYSLINIFLVMLLPFVFIGFWKFKSPNMQFTDELLIKWLPLLTWVSISIIYMGNARYKAPLVIYFLMWAAVSWRYRQKYRSSLLLVYAVGIISIFTILPIAAIFR